jgi:hypothetical protein
MRRGPHTTRRKRRPRRTNRCRGPSRSESLSPAASQGNGCVDGRKYVINGDGVKVYGVWFLPRDEPEPTAIVDAAGQE